MFAIVPQKLTLSCPPQENCRSLNQSHKAKDASSDSSKGQKFIQQFISILFCILLNIGPYNIIKCILRPQMLKY